MFEQIIVENRKFVQETVIQYIFPREKIVSKNSVLLGVRRSWKSYHLYSLAHQMPDDFLYINFEDERLIGFDVSQLYRFIETYEELYDKKPKLILLDEVQQILGFEKFVRRLRDQHYDVVVTWSNAFIDNKEIATTLWWRLQEIYVYPLSFKEYLMFSKIPYNKESLYTKKTKIIKMFKEYLYGGGFPEVRNKSSWEKRNYINTIFNSVFYRDIVAKYSLKNERWLKLFFQKLAETVGNAYSFNNMKNKIKEFTPIATQTLIEYNTYAHEWFLIYNIYNYTNSFHTKQMSRKTYFVDSGLLSLFLVNADTRLLENLVFNELQRSYQEIFYIKESSYEVDFFIPKVKLLIQVSWELRSPDTLKREIKWLCRAAKKYAVKDMYILTLDTEKDIKHEWYIIHIVPVWKYILDT